MILIFLCTPLCIIILNRQNIIKINFSRPGSSAKSGDCPEIARAFSGMQE
jgi:hypothetical protein